MGVEFARAVAVVIGVKYLVAVIIVISFVKLARVICLYYCVCLVVRSSHVLAKDVGGYIIRKARVARRLCVSTLTMHIAHHYHRHILPVLHHHIVPVTPIVSSVMLLSRQGKSTIYSSVI